MTVSIRVHSINCLFIYFWRRRNGSETLICAGEPSPLIMTLQHPPRTLTSSLNLTMQKSAGLRSGSISTRMQYFTGCRRISRFSASFAHLGREMQARRRNFAKTRFYARKKHKTWMLVFARRT